MKRIFDRLLKALLPIMILMVVLFIIITFGSHFKSSSGAKEEQTVTDESESEDLNKGQQSKGKYVLIEPTETKEVDRSEFKDYSELQRTLQTILKNTN